MFYFFWYIRVFPPWVTKVEIANSWYFAQQYTILSKVRYTCILTKSHEMEKQKRKHILRYYFSAYLPVTTSVISLGSCFKAYLSDMKSMTRWHISHLEHNHYRVLEMSGSHSSHWHYPRSKTKPPCFTPLVSRHFA